MTPITCKLATLLALTIAPNDLQVVDYLVQVLQSLTGRSPGVHRCVFYGTQRERPFDNSLGALLRDPRLDLVITRWVVGGAFRVEREEMLRYPMLIVVEGEDIGGNVDSFMVNLKKVTPNLRMVVLLTNVNDFWRYRQYLHSMHEFEVLFVDVLKRRTFVTSLGKLTKMDYLLEPDGLFSGTISSRYNMNKLLKYCKRQVIYFMDDIWMKETATLMNTTALKLKHSCPLAKIHPYDKCYWLFMAREQIDIELSTFHADSRFPDPDFTFLFTNMMVGNILAVPRSALDMVQLFTMPFDWEVWITLIMILAIAEIFYLTFPTIIRNDPVLLILCGYEKYNLHHAGIREKFLLMPLIVLMFFASCAYETKLLSMMTSKPASRNIRTVQQLIESGVKIKSDLLISPFQFKDSSVRDILVNSSVDYTKLDMVHAYLIDRSSAKYLATRYYDPNQRLHRYNLLDSAFHVQPVAYYLSYRNPIQEVLMFTLTCLIESGIYDFIEQLNLEICAKMLDPPIFDGSSESDAAVLYYADFKPAWIVIVLGMGASLVSFLVEVLVGNIVKIKVSTMLLWRKILKYFTRFERNRAKTRC